MHILVLGAGVAGLTTSLCLLQKGFKVTIFAKHISPNTTSDIAAALWEPYLCEPRERVTGWAFESLKIFKALALNNSEDHGIVLRKAYLLGKHKIEAPFWMNDSVDPVFFSSENDVDGVLKRSGGYYAHGLKYNVPSIDMSIYLEWLLKNILSLGGKIQLKHVKDIKDLMKSKFDVIVNCTGLGSYTLLNDKEMYPIRGQLVLVEAPWIKEFYFDELENAYIIPRKNVVCLGGTADRSWNTKIDHDTTKKIIEKCAKIDPKIATDAKIVQVRVGLRPGRSEVRLETDMSFEKPVIHNYGHGGAGVTLSWGCATEVCSLVFEIAMKKHKAKL